jgi:hypothetical protein
MDGMLAALTFLSAPRFVQKMAELSSQENVRGYLVPTPSRMVVTVVPVALEHFRQRLPLPVSRTQKDRLRALTQPMRGAFFV